MSNTGLAWKSQYVSMRDGVRLAIGTWKNVHKHRRAKQPAVLIMTRYWRAIAFREEAAEQQLNYNLARFLAEYGYVLVVADARGTGASFGCREAELSTKEIEDIAEVINWLSDQPWCDGRVVTIGTSYTANTALHALIKAPRALKLAICRAPDFDLKRHLFSPGGITNRWFIEQWGETTAALDGNDVNALARSCPWAATKYCAFENLLGVRPVDDDTDGTMLAQAVHEHKKNFNVLSLVSGSDAAYSDISGHKNFHSDLFAHKDAIEASNVPIVVRCGWHDAGTALGALSMFATFKTSMHIIVGPWNHSGDFRADPLQIGRATAPEAIPRKQEFDLVVRSIEEGLGRGSQREGGAADGDDHKIVEYYTLGENRWKRTDKWPPPHARMRRLYFSRGNRLSNAAPMVREGSDVYQLDFTAGTGKYNRWHTQMGHPVFFPDRSEEDDKLLIYDTEPLEQDVEITGHPIVHLFVRSTAADGQFFVYFEAIDLDGSVRLLTEGQLRAIHRKVSDESPPYHMFGPYHSLEQRDMEYLIPNEVAELSFDLYPISVLLKRGQRIRVAIAGADKDVFPVDGETCPTITIERNCTHASAIDLPFLEPVN